MKLKVCAVLVILFTLTVELRAKAQVTKFAPVEDWIAFKRRTSDIKPLDKFLGKLRATYDFVFHKPENVSNVEKILSSDKSVDSAVHPYKFILSNSQVADKIVKDKNEEPTETPVYVELLPDEMIPTRETSISKVATDWLDEVEVPVPLGELEILDDGDGVDKSIETVGSHTSFELPAAVARAFIRWLSSIIGFTHGAYLKFTNATSAI